MDEARSLQYSIDVKANVEKAEQDIQNLIGQCGKLRAEVSGTFIISVGADTEEAEENIRELTENIGELQDEAEEEDEEGWKDEIFATVAHEFTHHLEETAGLHALDDKDLEFLREALAEYE